MSVTLLAVANALQKQHKEGKACFGHSLRVQPILEGKSQGTRRLVTWWAQSGRNECSARLVFPILGRRETEAERINVLEVIFKIFFKDLFILSMCMTGLPTCMCVQCACLVPKVRRGSQILELEFQVLSHPVVAGNWGALEKQPALLICQLPSPLGVIFVPASPLLLLSWDKTVKSPQLRAVGELWAEQNGIQI